MLRYLLVFLAGALLGANITYFYAGRDAPREPASTDRAAPAPVMPMGAAPQTSSSAVSPAPPVATAPPPAPTPGGLVIPVQGIKPDQLVDTYTQSRGEGRVHDAIDIMASTGTPVVAAVDGPVAKLFTSARGGVTIYQYDREGRRVYYYAHLQGYVDGLAEGQMLRQGQVIGYVGSSGNADPAAPHLHFTVGDLGLERKWWKSTPVNPYPLLTVAPPR
ncbi:MAG: M23 family metallopeptidase [Lysobacter sp.]|nr:MAG: M23 family metallopeptidase [Lysobacter sp.]